MEYSVEMTEFLLVLATIPSQTPLTRINYQYFIGWAEISITQSHMINWKYPGHSFEWNAIIVIQKRGNKKNMHSNSKAIMRRIFYRLYLGNTYISRL